MKRVTTAFLELVRDMVNDMLAIEHRTCWHSDAGRNHLIFMTFNEHTAKKAIQALGDAGVLCETVVGRTKTTMLTEEVG